MIGIDTNVLVRFLVQDDAEQGRIASELIDGLSASEPGFISREVMVELVWVLERAYRLSRSEIRAALDGLLEAQELVIEAADRAALAADRYGKGGAGFADQMVALAGQGAGALETVTFDRKASGIPGMRLLATVADH